jgi:hypothetical protein
MAVSQGLKELAKKLQLEADAVIAEAEHSPALFGLVLETIASAAMHLEKVGSALESVEPVVTTEVLETVASLAQALDETGDDELIKRASLLDELLVTISAPKNAVAQAKADTEDEINKLRAKYRGEQGEDLYHKRTQSLAEQANKKNVAEAVESIRTYRPMEAPLTTRYCPDHPGVSVMRIADRVYQCGLDKKIYNYEAGFTTEKGNIIPGGGVENQIPDWGHRDPGKTVFDNRESLMSRFTSKEEGMVKLAQVPAHTISMDHDKKQLIISVPVGTSEDQKKMIEQNVVGTYGKLYPIMFKEASLKKKLAQFEGGEEEDDDFEEEFDGPEEFTIELTDEEHEELMIFGGNSDSVGLLFEGLELVRHMPEKGAAIYKIKIGDLYGAYFATASDGAGLGIVPFINKNLQAKIYALFKKSEADVNYDEVLNPNIKFSPHKGRSVLAADESKQK